MVASLVPRLLLVFQTLKSWDGPGDKANGDHGGPNFQNLYLGTSMDSSWGGGTTFMYASCCIGLIIIEAH